MTLNDWVKAEIDKLGIVFNDENYLVIKQLEAILYPMGEEQIRLTAMEDDFKNRLLNVYQPQLDAILIAQGKSLSLTAKATAIDTSVNAKEVEFGITYEKAVEEIPPESPFEEIVG